MGQIFCYGNDVDNEVRVIDQGNMSTLNCPEEVYLAEKLIGIHQWADRWILPDLAVRPMQ